MVSLVLLYGLSSWTKSIDLPRQAEPKLTLVQQAASLDKALQNLSKAAQVQLEASPQTANEIVTFRFQDVPLSEAMNRIAQAVDGTWKTDGSVQRLTRTSDQVRTEKGREFALDVAAIQKSLNKRLDALRNQPAWSSEEADKLATQLSAHLKQFHPGSDQQNWYQQTSQLNEQAPMGRIMSRVLALLDPQELANLPMFYKTVWSSNPTSVQRPMPQGLAPIIEQFTQDQAEWKAAMQRHSVANPTFNGVTYQLGDYGDGNSGSPEPGPITTVLLTASRWGGPSGINIGFAAYDAKGNKVAQTDTSLANDVSDYAGDPKPDPAEEAEPLITYSGDSKRIFDTFPNGARANAKQVPPDLIQKLSVPEDNDPLSFLVSPGLVQAAEIRRVNMVGCLADSTLYAGTIGGGQQLHVSQFLSRFAIFQTACEFRDGWLMVIPRRAYAERMLRANRKMLGAYLQRLSTGKWMNIDERAYFALNLPDAQTNILPYTMSALIHQQSNEYFDANMLCLYALLTQDQKSQMQNGGLAFGAFTEQEAEYVNRMVYGPNEQLRYNPQPDANGVSAFRTEDFQLYNNGLLKEATESLPNGVSPRTLIKLTTNNSNVVIAGGTDDTAYPNSRMMTAGDLAWQKYSQEHVDLFPWMRDQGQKVDLTNLRLGQRLQLTFNFAFTTSLSMVQTLEDKNLREFTRVTMDSLPDDFKKEFDSNYENYRKSYAYVKPGDFGRPPTSGNPPPK